MKKRWLALIISLSLLVGAGIGVGIFAICDACNEKDVAPQLVLASPETVYLTDFRYTYDVDTGARTFAYCFVNNSDEDLSIAIGYPALERRSGDTWIMLEYGIEEGCAIYRARSGINSIYPLENIIARVNGFAEQGLLKSNDPVGEYRLVYNFDYFDVIATFSVTEEMLP